MPRVAAAVRRHVKNEREANLALLRSVGRQHAQQIRDAVIKESRFDVLLTDVFADLKPQPIHFEVLDAFTNHRSSLILASRGVGKTASGTTLYVIGRLLQDPNLSILIISRSGELAREIVHGIKKRLVDENLVRIFGRQRAFNFQTWKTAAIEVCTKTNNTKEPSVFAAGLGTQITGKHFGEIIAEDVVDPKNSQTEKQQEAIRSFFWTTVLPTLKKGGRLHIVGTRYHQRDFYHTTISEKIVEHCVRLPVLREIEVVDSIGKPTGKKYFASAAPALAPVRELLTLRERMPISAWSMQYDCTTELGDDRLFEWRFFDRESFWFDDDMPKEFPRVISFDPAACNNSSSDWFAFAIAAKGNDGHCYLEKVGKFRVKFHKQLEYAKKLIEEHNVFYINVEANGYQGVFAQELARKIPQFAGRIKKTPTTMGKELRATRLSTKIAEGVVHFSRQLRPLAVYLMRYPKISHDDILDAVDGVTDTIMQLKIRQRAKPRDNIRSLCF